jgi:hypothetical protein
MQNHFNFGFDRNEDNKRSPLRLNPSTRLNESSLFTVETKNDFQNISQSYNPNPYAIKTSTNFVLTKKRSKYELKAPCTQSYNIKITTKLNESQNRLKSFLITFSFICLVMILISGVLLFIIFGVVPCSIMKCHSKANTCKNEFFKANCICDYGFAGNGKDYCDECGLTYTHMNARYLKVDNNNFTSRIVGGSVALDESWPSTVLIAMNYKADVNISYLSRQLNYNNDQDESKITVEATFICSGTLINRKTVLTAAHCIIRNFEHLYGDSTHVIEVKTNKYYPTLASMYKVYVGINDRTVIKKNSDDIPPSQVKVKEIIIVSKSQSWKTDLWSNYQVLK